MIAHIACAARLTVAATCAGIAVVSLAADNALAVARHAIKAVTR